MKRGMNAIPRIRINNLPTPLVELKRLSRALGGPRIFMKRDDLTGVALGGNKTRKLEFLLGEALSGKCDSVVTGGAMQSNHCRQTAAAAAAVGLECHLALGGEPPAIPEGNLLLDHIFGAIVHWCGANAKGELIPQITEDLRSRGRTPYVIPFGGSNATGAFGFVAAVSELIGQMQDADLRFDRLIVPSSSGGTHAGLVVGADVFDLAADVIGIGIDRAAPGKPSYESELAALANQVAERLGVDARYDACAFRMRYDYFGGGYGVVGDAEREAIRLVGAQEGILLDPVYSARAMGALIDMIRREEFARGDSVLFWHTGGIPAVFDHAKDIVPR
ncbi:MAG: D-cysteine desulfhydrase family protein [Candidatus Krumholzibacteria bacterium]|nr:D-cysteine desulfhydrase family protein [Candidatus Krumholzibacteria bacterium]